MENKRKQTKNQHIIPKCYLQEFKPSNLKTKHVFTYKKENKKWIKTGMKDHLFMEDFFYDKTSPNIDDKEQEIENYLAKYETYYRGLLKKIIKEDVLSKKEKFYFINFLILLMARSKEYLEDFERFIKKNDSFSISDKNNLHNTRDKALISLTSTKITEMIIPNGFILIENNTKIPFISGDHPYFFQFDDSTKEEQIIFILTPKYAIALSSIKQEVTKTDLDNRIDIINFNKTINEYSKEYLISSEMLDKEYFT